MEQEAKEITKNHDVPAEGLLIQGSITKTIKNMVNNYNIDLVVAGHRKKDFLYDLLTSNRKKDLVDELKIPLLSVPLQP